MPNQTLYLSVNFSEIVTVTGTPRVQLTLGSNSVYADYSSGSGTAVLVFSYFFQSGDLDSDGVDSVSPLQLNSGTIKSAGDVPANLAFTGENWSNVLVTTPGTTLSSADNLCPGPGTQDATMGSNPSVVSLQRLSTNWSHSCSGVLLSNNKVLTAFHCVDGMNLSTLRVVAGLYQRSDDSVSQTSSVSSYVSPQPGDPGYIVGGQNDIAVLTLTQNFHVGNGNVGIATLPLDNTNLFEGYLMSTFGWGRLGSSSILPDILQCGGGHPILTQSEADVEFSGIPSVTIDAGQIVFKDLSGNFMSGSGSDGGPVFVDDSGVITLVGIRSYGISDGSGNQNPFYPMVSARVGHYVSWIQANM